MQLKKGYNFISGNPSTNTKDPGFLSDVFEFKFFYETPDKKYQIPTALKIVDESSCSFRGTPTVVKDLVDYKYSLTENDVHFQSDFPKPLLGESFTASDGYQKKKISIDKEKYVVVEAVCREFSVEFFYQKKVNFSSEFSDMIQSKLNPNDESSYFKMFNEFGTHFVESGHMGAKYSMESSFNLANWSCLIISKIDVSHIAEVSFSHDMDPSYPIPFNESTSVQLFEYLRDKKVISIVGEAPHSSDYKEWESKVNSNPVLQGYSLRTLDVLLTKENFPEDKNIIAKQEAFSVHLNNYCQNVEGCKAPDFLPANCKQLKEEGNYIDQKYTIYFQNQKKKPIEVFCTNMKKSVKEVPREYVIVSIVAVDLLWGDVSGFMQCDCFNKGQTVHYGVPIDPNNLSIRQTDKEMAKYTGNFTPWGQVVSTNDLCGCCQQEVTYSLQGTNLAFDDIHSKYPFGNYRFLDEKKQVVFLKMNYCGPCKLQGITWCIFGFTNLIHINSL